MYSMILLVGKHRQKYSKVAMRSGSAMMKVADCTLFTLNMMSCTPMV